MALTESCRVFSWGYNEFGQLGHNALLSCLGKSVNKPKFKEIKNNFKVNIIFVKVNCGLTHSLLLSHIFGINNI